VRFRDFFRDFRLRCTFEECLRRNYWR